MKSSEEYPLIGEVHVDEFFFGGSEKEQYGRSSSARKKRACIAVEVLPGKKIGRIYSLKIENFSTQELKKIFEKHLRGAKTIVTDEWIGYKPLMKMYPGLIQKKSETGRAFSELHTIVMLLKKFMKGIHHNVSNHRFQCYLDEFVYRFNRRNNMKTINTNLLTRVIKTKPLIQEDPPKLLKNVA